MDSSVKIKKGQIEDYISDTTRLELEKYELKGQGGGGGGQISVTLEEARKLIEDKELKVGATYKISGVHKEMLYDDGSRNLTTRAINVTITNEGSGYVPNIEDGYVVDILGGSGTKMQCRLRVEEDGTIFLKDAVPSVYAIENTAGNVISDAMGYQIGDVLTIDNSQMGGTGSGFTATITEDNLEIVEEPKGTTIYLTALTTDKLSDEGFGEFFNPKYTTSDEAFGIFNDRSSYTPTQEIETTRLVSDYDFDTAENPSVMIEDDNNNIYLVNSNSGGSIGNTGIITKIDGDGNASVFCEIPDESPIAIKRESFTNTFFVLTMGYVYKVSGDGQTVEIFGETGSGINGENGGINGDGYPTDLVILGTDSVLVCKNYVNKIIQISNDGNTSTTTVLTTVGNHPISMIYNSDGFVYVVCMESNNVYKVDYVEKTSELFAETDSMPMQIIIGNDNNFYVICMGGNENGGTLRKIIKATGVSTVFAQVGYSPRRVFRDSVNYRFLVVGGNDINGNKTVYTVGQGDGLVQEYAKNVGDYPYDIIFQPNINRMSVSDYSRNKMMYVNPNMYVDLTVIPFNVNETFTTDNGATGKMFGGLDSQEFYPLSGEWETATKMIGDESGAVASLLKGGRSQYAYSPYNWSLWGKNIAVGLSEVGENSSEIITPIGSFVAIPFTSNQGLLTQQLVNFINDNATEPYGIRAVYAPFSTLNMFLYNDSDVWRRIVLSVTTVGNPSGGTSYWRMEADPLSSSVTIRTVEIDDKTIYGGYSWKNLTGELGGINFNGDFQGQQTIALDDVNWQKLPYTLDDYNFEICKIKYDFENDLIVYREDKNGNVVEYTYTDAMNFYELSAIAVYQWGNIGGSFGNKILHSYVEDVNFGGYVNYGNHYELTNLANNIFGKFSRNIGNKYFNSQGQYNIYIDTNNIRNTYINSSDNEYNTYCSGVVNSENTYNLCNNNNNVYKSYAENKGNVYENESENANNVYGENTRNRYNVYWQLSSNSDNVYGNGVTNDKNIYLQGSGNYGNQYENNVQNRENTYGLDVKNSDNSYGENTQNIGNIFETGAINTNNIYGKDVINLNNTYGMNCTNDSNNYGDNTINQRNVYADTINSNNSYVGLVKNEYNTYDSDSENTGNTYNGNSGVYLENTKNVYGKKCYNLNNTYEGNCYNNHNNYENETSNSNNTYVNTNNSKNQYYGSSNSGNSYESGTQNTNNTYGQDTNNTGNTYKQGTNNSMNTYKDNANNASNIYNSMQNIMNTHEKRSNVNNNTFNNGTHFDGNIFGENSNFTNMTFGFSVSFKINTLKKYANISQFTIGNNTNMNQNVFGGYSYFSNAVLGYGVYFNSNEFEDNGTFSNMNLNDGVNYSENKSEKNVIHSGNTYGNNCVVTNNLFKAKMYDTSNTYYDTKIINNVFGIEMTFSGNRINPDQNGSYPSNFQKNVFAKNMTFAGNSFLGTSEINENVFKNRVSFSGNTYGDMCTFNGNEFKGSLTDMGSANNSGNTYGDYCNIDFNKFGYNVVNNGNTYNDNVKNIGNVYGNDCIVTTNIYKMSVENSFNTYGSNCNNSRNDYGNMSLNKNNVYGFNTRNSDNIYTNMVSNIGNKFGNNSSNEYNEYTGAESEPFYNDYNTYGSNCNNNTNKYLGMGSNSYNKYGDFATNLQNTYGLRISHRGNVFVGRVDNSGISQSRENVFGNDVVVMNNIFGEDSRQVQNTFGNSCQYVRNKYGQQTHMGVNTFGNNVQHRDNEFGNSMQISNNTYNNGAVVSRMVFGAGSAFNQNTFDENCNVYGNNFGADSMFEQNTIKAQFFNNKFNGSLFMRTNTFNSSLQNCTAFGRLTFDANVLPEGGINIDGVMFENKVMFQGIVKIDSLATKAIFASFARTVYQKPDESKKVRYYNDEDVMVITDPV